MQDYRKLDAWRMAQRLAVLIYRVTEDFPASERFGLVPQLRRSAISIPSNIAEGCGRESRRELARFVSIASGSAHELETQLRLAADLALTGNEQLTRALRAVNELKRVLAGLRRSLKAEIG